jgi:putative endonuclease
MNSVGGIVRSGAVGFSPADAVIMGGRDKPGHDGEGGGLEPVQYTAAVYIMASRKHGTLYVGVTSDLIGRVVQHREGLVEGFTKTHGVKRLVWYERYESIGPAIQREKSLKKYRREWKINLIERENPHWDDLFPALVREEGPLSHLQLPERSL